MIVIDSSIFRFKGSEILVLLYLITHADEKGVCNTSYSLLSHDLDLSVQSCRTIMNRLKALNEIATTSTNKITQVTILKYDSYTTFIVEHQQAKILEKQAEIDSLTARINELEEQLERGKKRKLGEVMPVSQKEQKGKIEERAKAFYNSLVPFVDSMGGQYPKEMIRAFYDYWSEPNKSKTKMRFELETTWDIGRRLITWSNRDRNFNKNNNNGYGRETITDKIQRSAEDASEFSRKLKAQREANLGNGDSSKVW